MLVRHLLQLSQQISEILKPFPPVIPRTAGKPIMMQIVHCACDHSHRHPYPENILLAKWWQYQQKYNQK
jgi:hypothetical protein